MVGSGFAVGAVLYSGVAAVSLLLWRAGPLEWATAPPEPHAGPLERVTETLDFQAEDLDTCPASCPAPSLAFCAGPLVDLVEPVLVRARAALEAARAWLLAACCGLVGLVLGLVIGRCTAPAPVSPPPRRPHGCRLGEADTARRPVG